GKLMESIEAALTLDEHPYLPFTVTNANVHRLPQIYERISYPNQLLLIINQNFAYNDLGCTLRYEVMDTMHASARKPYTYLNPAFLTLRQRGGNDPAQPTCKAVSTSVVISPFDELVLPCYHLGLETVPINGRLYELWH